MDELDFELRGDYIPLDALLKATGLASSGGSARMLITDGQVLVDGQAELRKTCKIRAGQRVSLGDVRVLVRAAS
ncbi:MAG: RNA-binding S4 domain-containing protein [Burkholderiales bacterium]|nr:RNA-binding S4 domain-containing protein [Burkholderiales bacterium]